MNIVHFIYNFSFGGIEKIVLDLAKEQSINGYKVTIIVCSTDGPMKAMFDQAKIRIFSLDRKSGFSIVYRKKDLKCLKILRNADVIHVHTSNVYFFLLSAVSKTPILQTIHGGLAIGRKKTLKIRLKNQINILLTRCLVRHVSFVSNFFQEFYHAEFGISYQKKSSVIKNGIPSNPVTPEEEILKYQSKFKNKYIFGTVSRLVSEKRVDLLIRAVSHLPRDDGWILIIVGDGISRLDLENQVRQHDLKNYVKFIGYSPHTLKWFAAMNLCVLPSKDEPFGITALEAISQGTETIALKDGGGLFEILNSISQYLICNDEEELISIINKRYSERQKKKPQNDTVPTKKLIEHSKKYLTADMASAFETQYKKLIK